MFAEGQIETVQKESFILEQVIFFDQVAILRPGLAAKLYSRRGWNGVFHTTALGTSTGVTVCSSLPLIWCSESEGPATVALPITKKPTVAKWHWNISEIDLMFQAGNHANNWLYNFLIQHSHQIDCRWTSDRMKLGGSGKAIFISIWQGVERLTDWIAWCKIQFPLHHHTDESRSWQNHAISLCTRHWSVT